jgi:hypothetical protein
VGGRVSPKLAVPSVFLAIGMVDGDETVVLARLCAKLVVGASAVAPNEAAGTSAIAVLLSMSVLLAQNEVRLASRERCHTTNSHELSCKCQLFENQKTDARFRKASVRREANVVTNRTTDSA